MASNMFSAAPSRNKPLVEFRAGRMRQRGKTVTPLTNKGMIQIVQGQDDGLIHFMWKDRTTSQIESDLTIFPGEATWKRVKQCTTGRVYILEFKEQDRRLFFWVQEPSEDNDEENAGKINQHINNPPAPEAAGGHGFGDVDQNQLLAMMGGGAPSAPRRTAVPAVSPQVVPSTASGPVPARTAVPAGQISDEHLQNILSGLGVDPAALQQPEALDASLPSIMNAEAILPLLNDPDVQERLLPLLPEGSRNREELQELLRSPQFQQAVAQFNSALHSGQLGQLMPLLGLSPTVGGPQGGVGALLQAIQEQARNSRQAGTQEPKSNSESKQDEGKEDKDKDDKMDESH